MIWNLEGTYLETCSCDAFGIQYEDKTGLSAPFSWAA